MLSLFGRNNLKTYKMGIRMIHKNAILRGIYTIQDAEDFKKRVLQSKTPVLVDFHAQWCGPCKMLAPRLECAIAAHGDKIHLAKVDVDDHTDLAMEYNVTAVPAIVAIKNGQVVDRLMGLQEEDKLNGFIKRIIGP